MHLIPSGSVEDSICNKAKNCEKRFFGFWKT